jgi:hypothetical protein
MRSPYRQQEFPSEFTLEKETLKFLLNDLLDIGRLKLLFLDIAMTISGLTSSQFTHAAFIRSCRMMSDKSGQKNRSWEFYSTEAIVNRRLTNPNEWWTVAQRRRQSVQLKISTKVYKRSHDHVVQESCMSEGLREKYDIHTSEGSGRKCSFSWVISRR